MIDLGLLCTDPKKAKDFLRFSRDVGWNSVGFNLYFRADGNGVRPLEFEGDNMECTVDPKLKFSTKSRKQSSPLTLSLWEESGLISGEDFIKRASVLLMDDFKPNSLSKFIDSNDYDIFSVIPTSKRSFQSSCESLNCDLINLNYYCYYSLFKLKRGLVNSALQRGCFFEVSLSDSFLKNKDLSKNFDSNLNEEVKIVFQRNLPTLIKYIPIKKLIISSGSADLSELPEPKIFLGSCNELFKGLSKKNLDLKCCLTKSPQNCLNKGMARRTFGTGICSYKVQENSRKTLTT